MATLGAEVIIPRAGLTVGLGVAAIAGAGVPLGAGVPPLTDGAAVGFSVPGKAMKNLLGSTDGAGSIVSGLGGSVGPDGRMEVGDGVSLTGVGVSAIFGAAVDPRFEGDAVGLSVGPDRTFGGGVGKELAWKGGLVGVKTTVGKGVGTRDVFVVGMGVGRSSDTEMKIGGTTTVGKGVGI